MIHDLIDSRKKTIRSNTNKNSKTLTENKPCCDNLNAEYSDNEVKETETLNTFIPPWLRNSLGLNQKNNQNLDWNLCLPNFNALGHVISDQKSTRTTAPKYKEPNINQLNDVKTNVETEHSSKGVRTDENFQKNSETEVTEDQSQDRIHADLNEKPILSSRNYPYKELEEQSVYINTEKILKRDDSKSTNVPITSPDSDKVKEEKKKKFMKQKKKIKKYFISDQSPELDKSDVDFLLETNAREVLDNYVKKDVHSVSSDIKQLEAKLILLNEKYQKADLSKLSHQEFRLLQEIKEQTGNRENFEKLMNHIKETNLKEILKTTNNWTKLVIDKNKEENDLNEKNGKESSKFFGIKENNSRILNDKDSVISTDDETDIKRFSEFLSKNKNLDEKKKCLEEVRNYFERKRRTRLTKRRCMEDKNQKYSSSILSEKKDDLPRERPKTSDVTSKPNSREKKNKVGVSEEEIVEKAVSETLQKFVNLYHFHVSPTMMGSLRKNILTAIQSDSYDSNQFKQNLPGQNENKANFDESLQNKSSLKNEDTVKNPQQQNSSLAVEKTENKDHFLLPLNKEGKKRTFKVIMDTSESQIEKPVAENDINDSESIKRLQKDFENCIKSIQSHTDVSKLRLQSVILEKKEHDSNTKDLQFVYNFTKKSLESVSKEVPEPKKKKDCETQVKVIQRSVKSQPSSLFEKHEKIMQTDVVSYSTKNVQTEGKAFGLKEMKELKGFDITPGLYRLVKSKDVSRFYLYPENPDKSPYTSISNETNSSVFRCKDCEKKAEEAENVEKQLSRKSDKETRIIYRNRDRSSRFFKTRRKSYLGNSSQKFPKKLFINTRSEDPLKCLYFENSVNESQSVVGSMSNTDEAMFFNDQIDIDSVINPSTNQHLGCFWFWNGEKINSGCDLKMHVENLLREKLKELVLPQIFSKPNYLLQNACETTQESNEKPSENISELQGKNCEKKSESRHKSALLCLKKNITPLTGSAPIISSGSYEFFKDNKGNAGRDEVVKSEELKKLENSTNSKKFVKEVGTQNSLQALSSINLKKIKSRSKTNSSRSRKLKKSSIKVFGEQKNEICTFKTVTDFQDALQKIKKTPIKNSLTWILELDNKPDNKNPEYTGKIRNLFSLVDQEVQTNNILQLVQEGLNEKSTQESLTGNLKHWQLIEKVLNKVSQKEQESLWNDVREFIKEKIGTDINDEGAKEVCIEIEHDVPNSGSGKSKQAIVAKGHYKKSEGDIEVEVDLTLEDLEKILQRRQKKTRRRQMRYSGRGKNLFTTSSAQTYQEELAKYQKYLKYEELSTLGGSLMSEKELKVLDKNNFI